MSICILFIHQVVKFLIKNETKVSIVNEKDLGILRLVVVVCCFGTKKGYCFTFPFFSVLSRLKKTIASLTLQADKLSKTSDR